MRDSQAPMSGSQVQAMAAYLRKRAADSAQIKYDTGTVVRVTQAGTGDR